MLFGQARSFALILPFLLGSALSAPCDLSTDISGLGEEIDFISSTTDISKIGEEIDFTVSATKLSVLGFSASVSYVTLPPGASAYIKIVGASEQPSITSGNGVITIQTGTCEAGPSSPTSSPTDASSASKIFPGFIMAPFLGTRGSGVASALLMSSLFVTGVFGHEGTCTPTLEIEISIPAGSEVTPNFGVTDHYLEANVDTVTWGYYDNDKPSQKSMNSGETITVEVITHHAGHDYEKMIRGDTNVEDIFYWASGQSLVDKPEAKLPGAGVHLITGPIEVVGAEPGDIVEIEILELDPRNNPLTGKCYGSNSQKFAGYHYNALTGEKRDGTKYTRDGGTEAITVFEFVEDNNGKMLYGEPVYMFRFPNMTAPDGSSRSFDNEPSVTIPHEFNHGHDGDVDAEAIVYPEGFDGTIVTDEGGIKYLSPDEAALTWKVPLRPHLGTLAVMPSNTDNYIDADATGGANSIPPSRFGGNIDDWRIGKGGTMFLKVEVAGAQIVVGDTHGAQGDGELAGTAMETSMTTKLRIALHKAGSLPTKVATLDFPLLETSTQFVVHGFAYANYLDELEDASTIFQVGTSLDLAMADCYIKTRNWLMDVYGLTEEETIAMMSTSIDFGITQVVDGNWGVHSDIDKWIFDETDAAYDYSCTTSKTGGRRHRALMHTDERRRILEEHMVASSPEEHANGLFEKVTGLCIDCNDNVVRRRLADRLLDAKLVFAKKNMHN